MTPGAILFDLDDTIIDCGGDPAPLWRELCVGAAAERGIDGEALFEIVERRRRWFWSDAERHRSGRLELRAARRRVVADALAELGQDSAELAARIADGYSDRRDACMCLFPDAVETLEVLRARGVRTALLTNGAGPVQRAKIERFSLAPLFDGIFVEGELGYGKPDPRAYRTAMASLGSTPADTWMVGDNLHWEVIAPQQLGLYTVWMDSRRRGLPPDAPGRPHRIIASLRELL